MQMHEVRHKQQLRISHNRILQKTQKLASGIRGYWSSSASHMFDKKIALLLIGDINNNWLKEITSIRMVDGMA